MEICLNPEFEKLLAPLSEEVLKALTESLLREGCRDPIVVWFDDEEGVYWILDGHNRYRICNHYGLKYKTKVITLPKGMCPEEWMVKNQCAKRNLTTFQKADLFLKIKPLIEAKAKENLKTPTGGKDKKKLEDSFTPQDWANYYDDVPY